MSDTTQHEPRALRPVLVASLAVLAAAGLAACGGDGGDGQDGGSAPGDTAAMSGAEGGATPPGGAGRRGAIMELRRIQKQLRGLRDKALEDTALDRQLQELRTMIDQAMREMSPEAGKRIDRLDSIRGELESARAEGDTARLRSLVREGRKLRQALQSVRSKAMQREEVSAALEDFRSALRERMREVDPSADSLMDRMDTLQQQMRSQMQQGVGGGGGDTAASDGPGG